MTEFYSIQLDNVTFSMYFKTYNQYGDTVYSRPYTISIAGGLQGNFEFNALSETGTGYATACEVAADMSDGRSLHFVAASEFYYQYNKWIIQLTSTSTETVYGVELTTTHAISFSFDTVGYTPTFIDYRVFGADAGGSHYTLHGSALVSDGVNVAVYCFCAGVRIRTPDGYRAVQALKRGDLVLTADGRAEPIEWLGRQTVSTRFADPTRVLPIRVRAGALSENLPVRDLLLSPDHALLVGGVLVQAGALVNGTSIVRETDVPETFVYYHVELADHALILAEGVPAETFVDNVDRMAFDNWAEHEALYPKGKSIPELPYPRAKSARQIPGALRQVLEARASLRAPGLVEAA